jgi:hypothetical protein
MSLLRPEVLEITLRIGLVFSTEHAQLEYEIRDAESQELFALDAVPHIAFHGMDDCLHAYVARLTENVRDWAGPFTP